MDDLLQCLTTDMGEETNVDALLIAEKILFAEKLVSFVTVKHHGVSYISDMHQSYRERVCNHFGRSIRRAVRLMLQKMEGELVEVFKILKRSGWLDRRHYMGYMKDMRKGYIATEFKPLKFLYFCVNVTKFAMHFYDEGVGKAPEFAFHAISYGIQSFDMQKEWERLKLAAQNYCPRTEIQCARTVCDEVPTVDNSKRVQISDVSSSGSESFSEEDDMFKVAKNLCLSPVEEYIRGFFSTEPSGSSTETSGHMSDDE